MVESFQTEPLEERKSQKLTFLDFGKEKLFWGLLPFALGGATLLTGHLTKFSLKPVLDGSPTIIAKGWNWLTNGALRKASGKVLTAADQEAFYDSLLFNFPRAFPEAIRDNARRHTWNFLKGFEIGAIPAVYMLWRKDEENRLDLLPAYDRLKKLGDLKPSDEELALENASLRQQLHFVEQKSASGLEASPRLHTAEATLEGTINASPERATRR